MPKKPAIEILPWVHHAGILLHEDLVKYLGKIPRGSLLAIELIPKESVFFREIMSLFAGNKPNIRRHKFVGGQEALILDHVATIKQLPERHGKDFLQEIEKFRILTEEDWAVLEVLNECGKRGIKLIPVENPFAKEFGNVAHALIEHVKAWKRREMFQFGSLMNVIRRTGRKIFVITGHGHALHLKNLLAEKGIDVKLNTSFYTYPQNLEDAIKLEEECRKNAINKELYGWELLRYSEEKTNIPRTQSLKTAKERIVSEIRQRAISITRKPQILQKKRPKKPKLKRKRRL